jgi:outer membrane protein
MYNYLTLLVFLLIACTPIQAETLIELYQLAEQNDPQLQIADQQRLAILEKKVQAHAPLLPQITIGAEARENWSYKNIKFGDSSENTTIGYNLSLNYALYRRDLNIKYEQTDSLIREAEANYEAEKQALIERVAKRYFAVLAANDNLKFVQSAKKAFKRQLKEAQLRFEAGLIAVTDVEEARAGYDLAVADEISAQNELDNAIESLREITGSYHRVLAVLKKNMPLLKPEPYDIDTWTETALEQNPQIIAAQHAIENARQEIDKQRAANSPTVDFVAEHSYDDIIRGDRNFYNNRDRAFRNSVGVQLNYQLYEGGAIRSRIREAKRRHDQALGKLERQRRRVQLQIRQAFLSLVSNLSKVKALKQAVKSNETALKAIQTGFELGTRTSVDVMNAQHDLLRAQRNHSNARYDYVVTTLQFKQASGLLTEGDLIAINNWLTKVTPKN